MTPNIKATLNKIRERVTAEPLWYADINNKPIEPDGIWYLDKEYLIKLLEIVEVLREACEFYAPYEWDYDKGETAREALEDVEKICGGE